MAKFRDMRRFTQIVKEYNDNEKGDLDIVAFVGKDDWLMKIVREDAQKKYQNQYNVSHIDAQEVYEDVVSNMYKYVNVETTPLKEKRLWVGSNGRDLLKNSGLFKEYTKHNKDLLHLILAFVTGFVLGIGGLIITIIKP